MAKIMTDADWQARSDAQTMATYQAILQDPKRMKKAIAAAKKEASLLEKQTSAMKQAAGTKRNKKG